MVESAVSCIVWAIRTYFILKGADVFNFLNLDDVRRYMKTEVQHDIDANTLYQSPRLNQSGLQNYPGLLLAAVTSGTADQFASQLGSQFFHTQEARTNSKTGEVTFAKVPHTANVTLCEGEFNRYYIRGVCMRAISLDQKYVVAYRARHSDNPRPESVAMVGRDFDASALLEALRKTHIVDNALGIPPGANSGMSIKIKT